MEESHNKKINYGVHEGFMFLVLGSVLLLAFSIFVFFVQILLWLKHGYWQPASINDLVVFLEDCRKKIFDDGFSVCMMEDTAQPETNWYGINLILDYVLNKTHIFFVSIALLCLSAGCAELVEDKN